MVILYLVTECVFVNLPYSRFVDDEESLLKLGDENAAKLFVAVFVFTVIHKGPFLVALLFQMPVVLAAYLCQLIWQ